MCAHIALIFSANRCSSIYRLLQFAISVANVIQVIVVEINQVPSISPDPNRPTQETPVSLTECNLSGRFCFSVGHIWNFEYDHRNSQHFPTLIR